MATKPTTVITAAGLALAVLLAGCSGGDEAGGPATSEDATQDAMATESADATQTPSPTEAEPTPTPSAVETAEDADADAGDDSALPPGFPDPATLIGQQSHDERAADGSWHTVVAGQPLDLVNVIGSCFDGGAGDICAYSIAAAVAPTADAPLPTEAALLLLLRNAGVEPDGSPTWVVLDAVVAQAPAGEPAYLDICDGTPGVVVFHDPDAAPSATITALDAWGPDAGIGSLVELDPAGLTCPYLGG